MTPYQPQPIDTSSVELSAEIEAVVELLARNIHENWAAQRLSDGWRWGPQADDARKLHPCLVPYEDLSESERAYDRLTARETLKLMVKLGFVIGPAG